MAAAERASTLPSNNLPIHLTSFVGRGEELAAVELLLASEPLVTLTGSGGCGKTRLAVQAATGLADRWPDGVWWVDLSPVRDPALVPTLIASTMGLLVEAAGGPLPALRSQLRDLRVLVCLDNCEHLLEPSAEVAEVLLQSCPEASVLATSREPLAVPGETVWRVPSLTEDEAVALFMDRAHRVRPWFTLDATSEDAVRTLCRRLDGIPLAIELAAAWMGTLTPAQVLAGLDDRFGLLVRGPRRVSSRQQTLVASIDWSHDLLDETDRVVFRRLAAFAGGFTLDAAQAVAAGGAGSAEADAADALDGSLSATEVLLALGRLVDKSLVVTEEHQGAARYRLLETIRAYAAERLDESGEASTCRDRHLDHFLALAEAAEDGLASQARDDWLARLEADHDNLRAAVRWGLALAEPERGRRLAAALAWLWWVHGHVQEGAELLQRAVDRAPDDRSALQGRLLAGMALVADTGGPLALELDAAQRGLEIATSNGDDRTRGRCLLLSAVVQFYVDFEAAWELCAQAQACAEAAGDAFVADTVLVVQGMLLSSRDRHEAARPLLEEGGRRCLRRGDRSYAALALNYQDDAALLTGDVRRAEQLALEALQVARPVDEYHIVGFAPSHLALARGMGGDVDGGRRLMTPVVRAVEGSGHGGHGGHVPRMARMAPVLGYLHLWAGDLDGAVAWFERDAHSTDPAPDSLIAARALPGLAAALRHLGRHEAAHQVADRALAVARRLGVPHLVADALEQLAWLAAAHDPGRAEDLHHRALAERVEHGLRTFAVDSLDALAELASRGGSHSEAARLLAASDTARQAMGYPRPPIDRPRYEATVATLRAALGDDFAARWNGGMELPLDEAVAYARRARGTRGRPPTGWASLTRTELDVVRLVAQGLTNPEIAARLFMSRATVKTHLQHVYRKLGVANRTELAALAITHGQPPPPSSQPPAGGA